MPIASYQPTKQTLGQVMGSTSPPIRVPDYQRDYSWQSKQVADFWSDLIGFDGQFPGTEIQGKEYFLGSAVLVRTPRHHLLLDGQQRLATATMLLSAMRDKLWQVNQNAASQIEKEFIVFEDHLAEGARKYKLELNVFDRSFFRAWIQDRAQDNLPSPTQRSHRLIMASRKYFDDKLGELWDTASNQAMAIRQTIRLASILTNQFGLVTVSSDDEDHAASIFETLNDRGLGLSTGDLLRSWLLTTGEPTTRTEMIRLWAEIFAASKKEKVEIVIRACWVSQYGDVKSRSMYKEIKQRLISDVTSPIDFTRRLHTDALTYRKLRKSATGDQIIDEVCKGLSKLKAAGCFATLIAAHNRYSPKDRAIVAKALASLTVRHNVVCRLDPTRLEAKAFEAARLISSDQTVSAVIASLRQLSPDSATFRANFATLAFKPARHGVVQILLRTIENNRANTGEKIIASPARVHIEHIYPQNPPASDRWADHEAHVYRLGNLTLLASRLNLQQQNVPFLQKVANYKQSQFLITQELATNCKWIAADIDARQLCLCREAETIWPADLVSLGQ